MKVAVVQFPGINCEYESVRALQAVGLQADIFRWNKSPDLLEAFDGYFIPGGWSYNDRIRGGSVAGRDPVMQKIGEETGNGKPALGVCNGFQILAEAGLLPREGEVSMALAANVIKQGGEVIRSGYYVGWVNLRCDNIKSAATCALEEGEILQIPIAHGEGNLVLEPDVLEEVNKNGQAIFRYCDGTGQTLPEYPVNINGSIDNIAGLSNKKGNVAGLMPHPERAAFGWQLPDYLTGDGPGRKVLESFKKYMEENK